MWEMFIIEDCFQSV